MREPIEAGLKVISSDGRLIGMLVDHRDGALAVREQHLFDEVVYIPDEQIADVRGGEIMLQSTFEAVSVLAAAAPPDAPQPEQPTTDWAVRGGWVGLDTQ